MYNKKLSTYYDFLYKEKNYSEECEFIKNNSCRFESLLDVGCGTLNHSILLSEYFTNVFAIDDSEEMVKIAKSKNKKANLRVENISLQSLNGEKFDTIISMFNVVNHVESLHDLIGFFNKTYSLLKIDGILIFDCWNGVACTIEKPHELNIKKIHEGYHTLTCETKTYTNLFDSISIMDSKVEIYDDITKIDEFEYTIRQKLWTPDILKQILEGIGFKIENIFPKFDSNSSACEKDYRLTFICKKK